MIENFDLKKSNQLKKNQNRLGSLKSTLKETKEIQIVKIQELSSIITKKGNKYYQLCRSGNIAIYEQMTKGKTIGFEVIKIKQIKGKEIYPGAESFGKSAWYYTNFDKATEKYNSLLGIKN